MVGVAGVFPVIADIAVFYGWIKRCGLIAAADGAGYQVGSKAQTQALTGVQFGGTFCKKTQLALIGIRPDRIVGCACCVDPGAGAIPV